MISASMQEALVQHFNKEIYASQLYLAMAAYLESEDLPGASHWMNVQAQEEIVHGLKIFNYVHERGGRMKVLGLEAPPVSWSSPREVFEKAYEHERFISASIDALVDQAREERDHATENFLVWFVNEQVEEEASVEEIVRQFKMVGESKQGLFMIDRGLKARSFDA